MVYLITFVIFISIFLLSYLIFSCLSRKPISRLDKYVNTQSENNNEKKKIKRLNLQTSINNLIDKLINVINLKKYKEKLYKMLIKTDIPLRAEEIIFLILLTSITVFIFSLIILKMLIISILLILTIPFIFESYIKNKINKRISIINQQLGDALNMMSSSLRAGHSITQAIETVGNEMPLPISKEFSRVVQEMQLGLSIEKAFENLLDRVPSDDFEMLITAILIQRQIGGNLSEILDNISGTIRQRIQLNSEVKALTAQGRISGWILGLLPMFIILLILIVNPDYINTLFTNTIGLIMLFIGLIGQLIGFFIIRNIIDIRY